MGKRKKLLIKISVALAGITLTVTVIFFTPLWETAILLSFLSAMGCYELLIPTGVIKSKTAACCCIILSTAIVWLQYFDMFENGLVMLSLLFLTFVPICFAVSGRFGESKSIAYIFLAVLVFPAFFSLLLPVMKEKAGNQLVLIPFIAAWSADTGAQFGGMAFGKHKLAPHISSNKSIEGFICGLFGGTLGMGIYELIIYLMGRPVPVVSLLAFGMLGAAFGTVGDLFFSYIKREHGLKDFGSLMPEHGGVLDRFDSVVFVIPLFYIYMNLFTVA